MHEKGVRVTASDHLGHAGIRLMESVLVSRRVVVVSLDQLLKAASINV